MNFVGCKHCYQLARYPHFMNMAVVEVDETCCEDFLVLRNGTLSWGFLGIFDFEPIRIILYVRLLSLKY